MWEKTQLEEMVWTEALRDEKAPGEFSVWLESQVRGREDGAKQISSDSAGQGPWTTGQDFELQTLISGEPLKMFVYQSDILKSHVCKRLKWQSYNRWGKNWERCKRAMKCPSKYLKYGIIRASAKFPTCSQKQGMQVRHAEGNVDIDSMLLCNRLCK